MTRQNPSDFLEETSIDQAEHRQDFQRSFVLEQAEDYHRNDFDHSLHPMSMLIEKNVDM